MTPYYSDSAVTIYHAVRMRPMPNNGIHGGSGVEYGRYLLAKWIKKGFRKTRKAQKKRRFA